MVDEEEVIVPTPKAASNCCPKALEANRKDTNARTTRVSFFTFFSMSVGTNLDVSPAHRVGFGVPSVPQDRYKRFLFIDLEITNLSFNHERRLAEMTKNVPCREAERKIVRSLLRTCSKGKSCGFWGGSTPDYF